MFLMFFLCLSPLFLLAQQARDSGPKIRWQSEQRFIFDKQGDSVQLHLKEWSYDSLGRLLSQAWYQYDPQERGVLTREELLQFEPSNFVLQETFRQYYPNQEPKTRYRVSKFLTYEVNRDSSKPILIQELDEYREPTREDTFWYDKSGRLLGYAEYRYTDNTSLFKHEYRYNSKGQRKDWKTYAVWTTVKRRGKVVAKRALRRHYRFRYDKQGRLTSADGFYYASKLRQYLTYHGEVVALDSTIVERRLKQTAAKRAETGQKYSLERELRVLAYNERGDMLRRRTENLGREPKGEIWRYAQGGDLELYEQYQGEVLLERGVWVYGGGRLLNKRTEKHASGQIQYLIEAKADEQGRIIEEVQRSGDKVVSIKKMRYNAENLLEETTLFLASGQRFEKIAYFYKYY